MHTIFGCPYSYAVAKPADIEFPRKKIHGRTAGGVMDAENTENMSEDHLIQQDVQYIPFKQFHAFSENGFDSSLFGCRFIVGGESLC